MSDVVTPRWKSRRAKGEIIFNPMQSSRRISSIDDVGTGFMYTNASLVTCAGNPSWRLEGQQLGAWGPTYFMSPGVTPSGPGYNMPLPVEALISENDLRDFVVEATTECLAKRGKADNNLYESLAEYRQVVKLLTRPTQSLFRFLKINGKKMKVLGPDKAWLTYRYGIKPMISDITAIVSGLQKKVGRTRSTTRATVNHGIAATSGVTKTFNSGVYISNLDFNIQSSDNVTVRAISLDDFVATAGSNIGFTTKGLITVPWELIPFSFVVDWFVNVGDVLNAYAPSFGYEQLGSCVTVSRARSSLYSVVNSYYTAGPLTMTSNSQGRFSSSLVSKTRASLGKAGFVVKSDFKFDRFTRVTDALALTSVVLSSYFGKR